MDADLEDPPEAVTALWTNRHPDIDVIFARRTGSRSRPDRRLASLLYRQSIRWVGGLRQGACLFALLSRPAVNRIVSQTESSSWLMPLIAASVATSSRSPSTAKRARAAVPAIAAGGDCARLPERCRK
ncbi:MAG: hypothetical protein H7A20_03990 [Rhodanobacteraceae bacterium]|nr:hypothetical protein [Rhodanobacteraceae bacterium]